MNSRMKLVPWLAVPLVGCASGPSRDLADARAAYQRASQGPAAQYAPAQLHVAQTSLNVAEKTYDDEGNSANARDRAYVAARKAQLAEVQASIIQSDHRTQLAAATIQSKQSQQQVATQQALDATRAALATERGELQSEKQRRQEAERRAADAIAQLASVAAVKQETRGTVITLSGAVIFASGKADLLPAAQDKLRQVADALKQSDPQTTFRVEGYTDSRGSAALNQDLSNRRAGAVRAYLVAHGISAERITAEGLGPANPVADNDTAEGRANNRRVEIVVQSPEQRSNPDNAGSSQSGANPMQQPSSSGVQGGSGSMQGSGNSRSGAGSNAGSSSPRSTNQGTQGSAPGTSTPR